MNCHGFEFHMIDSPEHGILVKCWTCGDQLTLKEAFCLLNGHTISSEQAEKLNLNNPKEMRLSTVCSRCGRPVIVRQNPIEHDQYHITEILAPETD